MSTKNKASYWRRKGQYPQLRIFKAITGAYQPLRLQIGKNFVARSLVPKLGIPFLFWAKSSTLPNGMSIWALRSIESAFVKSVESAIYEPLMQVLNQLGKGDLVSIYVGTEKIIVSFCIPNGMVLDFHFTSRQVNYSEIQILAESLFDRFIQQIERAEEEEPEEVLSD